MIYVITSPSTCSTHFNPRATHTHTRTHTHNKATSRKEKGKRKKNKDPITPNRFPPSRSTIHSLLFLPDLLVYFQHHCTFFFHPIYPLTYLGICSPSPPTTPHNTYIYPTSSDYRKTPPVPLFASGSWGGRGCCSGSETSGRTFYPY